ncbi:hypothetical protein SAY87_007618 [Trapa incisa]|uniref:Auxin transport protein BIG n=1 Tax=Trapa incisa TaxID=236973 RepID=A0AAN7QF58_9MYRT|nr:hypothetical protein SAY87_007618 [Trapa incisa]
MEDLTKLLQVLSEDTNGGDLSLRLRSNASAKAGLQVFYSILRRGVDAIPDENSRFGIQLWTEAQIQAVLSIAFPLVFATRSLPAEEVEPSLIAVVQKLLEFCIVYLENSSIEIDDLSMQNNFVQLLEMALTDRSDRSSDASKALLSDGTLNSLLVFSGNSIDMGLNKHMKCYLHGCTRQEKVVDYPVRLLAFEFAQPKNQMQRLNGPDFHWKVDKFSFITQHWAIVHIGCIQRLIFLCKNLIIIPLDQKTAGSNLARRLSLSLRILKLLGDLSHYIPHVGDDSVLLEACASYTDAFKGLFSVRFEFVNSSSIIEGTFEGLMLLLLEEFLHLIQVFFGNTAVFQNVQAYLAASMLDALASVEWRYDKSATNVKPPFAYFPRVVVFVLKLINEVSRQAYQVFDWKDGARKSMGSLEGIPSDSSCSLLSKKVDLIERYSIEDLMIFIFPISKQWLDSLIHLLLFLFSEGVKSGQKMEMSNYTAARTGCPSEVESAASHDEEAIFGDLFSEGGRSVVSADDQLAGVVNSVSCNCNMSMEAASELLNFLKVSIFSPQWHQTLFSDACESLNQAHIDILFSIIENEASDPSDNTPGCSGGGQEGKKVEHVQELCFGLLYNLLRLRVLSDKLEDYLVHLILKFENGMFLYNGWTLTLLAHTLLCRVGLEGTQLRSQIYKVFIAFIVEKAKAIQDGSSNLKELLQSLPSVFHTEILLVAFHLSSHEEKVVLATSIFCSINEMSVAASCLTTAQLSCWALLVSRLVLLLRHMLFYPKDCPPTLLLDLQTKMREAPAGTIILSENVNGHLTSWAAVVLHRVMGSWVHEDPIANRLINHLTDAVPFPVSPNRDYQSIDCLIMGWSDVCESFSQILALWKDKRAALVDDLIVERYLFGLCWDMPVIGKLIDHLHFPLSKPENMVISDMRHFFQFSHMVLGGYPVQEGQLLNVVFAVLEKLQAVSLPERPEEIEWNFLRSGMWLCLALSVLNVGILGYSVKDGVLGTSPFSGEDVSKGNDYVVNAVSLISSAVEAGRVTELVKMLSSLLNRCLLVFQKFLVFTFQNSEQNIRKFLPLMLLVHAAFDKSIRDELLKKSGISSSMLECVTDLIIKQDLAVDRRSSGFIHKTLWNFITHGFPLVSCPSAILLSCMQNIKEIICTLDIVLKLDDGAYSCLDPGTVHQIAHAVISIKFNKIFDSLHDKCEALLNRLGGNIGGPVLEDLFLMKQMEEFLRDINASEGCEDDTLELLIDKFIGFTDNLSKDPSKFEILKCYFSVGIDGTQMKLPNGLHSGNMMVLMDSLDNCYFEAVNVKVFNFFVNMLSGELGADIKLKLHDKFMSMDLPSLGKWIERRLLGCILDDSEGVRCPRGVSVSMRDSTMSFLLLLASSSGELSSTDFESHLFEGLLHSLDAAFLCFDIHVAKSYFHFVVQLVKGEGSLKLLLERTFILMKKLVGDQRSVSGLKFIFGFLGSILREYGSQRNYLEMPSAKSLSGISPVLGHVTSKFVGSRKTSDALILTSNEESGSALFDCDATSVDEDEDDGTSDGEVASVDKEEEDDANSEKALASKVCTFTSSGSNFMEQHWYFCYTCDLTVSKGCCSVCAKVCHRGHRVVYSRLSRFFCDCGAGGVRGSNCQCLKPRKFTGNSSKPSTRPTNLPSVLPLSEDGSHIPESDSDMDEDFGNEGDITLGLSIPRDHQVGIKLMLEKQEFEARVMDLCVSLMPSIIERRNSNLSKDGNVILGEDKVVSYGVDLLQLKKAYKSGSLDLKIKADYSNSKELKSHLASGSLVKSLLSVSVRGRLAVGEGDKVAIFDVGQLIGQATVAPVTADKTNVKPLSKNIVRFEIVHLSFNSSAENHLAVAGYEDCQVLTLNSRGEVTDRLAIELALQGAYIRCVDWVPGSQVQLLVVTNKFVKIYDLSQDNISPLRYFTLADEMIVDAALCTASHGRMFLIVLSERGILYRLDLSKEGIIGPTPLMEIIPMPGKEICSKGLSLYFSPAYRLLFLSQYDGSTLIGQLSPDADSFVEVSYVYEEDQDTKHRAAGLHHWKELLAGTGLFSCMSSIKSNSALAVSIGAHDLTAQSIRHALGSSAPLVGMTAYKPLSKDKIHCLVLHDDGSLHIYSYASTGGDVNTNAASEKIKKLGVGILNNKAFSGANPEFPLDFFEKTICITADVKLGGDAIRNGDSESAKQSLASEEGCLESPSILGFKISVSNSNPDIVMVGFRVHVGNTSPSHIPCNITIFQRVIKLDEGMRSWYDVPFTVAESLLADEEFVIAVGPSFSGSALPRIDALEVYGRSKDEFGWKEKIDTVLEMEAHVLGNKSVLVGRGRKFQSMQSASIQEQVVADGLKLLSRFYSFSQVQDHSRIEDLNLGLNKVKCKQILEDIFQSDREPLLQSAACRVLQALFPKKDIYYQVKDTMRLHGVVSSASILSSRLGVGSAVGSWIVEEFTAQMHAVSKIALHRRANLAAFLETNGSNVVDGLMRVLWGILDLEQPDTQTMNNIVISSVELIYCYAECLALHGKCCSQGSVAPAVVLMKQLLFSSNQAIQTASSLAISSRLLQVPFPRQTMLTADDTVENAFSTTAPAETGVTSSQVMVEEDSVTSSVQYCCDGCSTVPILRRRWHCTICPDFDLCEACYEVLSAEELPPPHTKDHRMTAIPIEMDSLGVHGHEVSYTTENTGESNLLPPAAPVNLQTSTPAIHILEPSESGEFSSSAVDSVSISASKREVNSLLLYDFLDQLKGWMETTSGVQAIPVMQLFYRLSSAVNGPFIGSSSPESLDLEKLINWFLCEIKIDKPFLASRRTPSGEVIVLVFVFFTLMLRNWQQPGSDNSVRNASGTSEMHDRSVSISASSSLDDHEKNDFASQLFHACNALRQQPFVNYLMDILQQLMHVFKSSVHFENSHSTSPGPGCGALLSVRRDLPAGSFSPFFSDAYVKSRHADVFVDYHRLLLENTFRLLYALVRPEKQDKTGEEVYRNTGSKDLKLDGYQDVLCSYINNPQTSFVRRYARRLFLHLCGSKTHYYSVRDAWQFSTEVKKFYKHVKKSGGFHNPASYERSVKIVKCLSTMAEVAFSRPRNWQKYCLRHGEVLSFLLDGTFYFGEESVIQILKLLSLAFYFGKDTFQPFQKVEAGETGSNTSKSSAQFVDAKKKMKDEDGNDSGSDKSYMDMEAAVDIFNDKGGEVLKQFIDCFLLEWNSSSIRSEARYVLHGIWHHGKQSMKETLLTSLLQKVKYLPMYGQNIVEYTELVTWLLGGKAADSISKPQSPEIVDRCLSTDIIKCIFEALHSQNELLANHPNSRLYSTLSGLVEFDGYYLESEPCVACSSPEVPYSRMKLESLKSETKFTDKRIIVKCTGSYTIQTVTMNVHDARKSKSVKVLNLYYNNRPVADLSELKNNWTLWKRAKSCHLAFNQTELKVEFPIPITACNFMIELDSFYENLQALSLEPLQCPRCSRPVTDKHGICSNCHENAYQCRQCRNINYENLDSFLCNECGYSKYGRFEFNFMAKLSFTFDDMENDDDMKRGLAAIESESENAHRRYQQLLGFKKPLMKIVSSIGENEMDSQQKDSVQQMMVSLPGPSCKINRKIALLGVLYGEKCKAAFDSVSKSVQTLQGLRRVLMNYLHQRNSDGGQHASRFIVSRSPNNCYGCAATFVTQCLDLLLVLSKHPAAKKQLVCAGILSELFQNNIHQGPKNARVQARAVLCALSEGDGNAVTELNHLIQKKVMYCLEHHRSMDIALATREELLLLSEICSLTDELWESRLRIAFQLLFSSIKLGAKHPAISEHVILPCLKIISQACTPPKPDAVDKEPGKSAALREDKKLTVSSSSGSTASSGKAVGEIIEKNWDTSNKVQDIPLVSYSEWEKGASYLDFVRRQYQVSQGVKVAGQRSRPQRQDYLALKYVLRWKRRVHGTSKGELPSFELGTWVKELVLSACSQSIRSEMCMLISLLSAQSSSRCFRLLNLLMGLLPATLSAGESAAEYFELLFRMIESEDARLFLTARGCLTTICKLMAQEVGNVESLERSLHIDISQGFILHKLVELLGKFLEVSNIRLRFMQGNLFPELLEALIVISGLIVQKTKLISDCNRLLKELLDSLLLENSENKRQFIHACINGLQIHGEERKGRTCLFILEQLCNLICPSKPEAVYLLILNKAHTQEEFIRGSMTKNPYSSSEIGPLMRDVKNKICHELDLIGLLEDDYSMELLVAGNIISLDLSIAQVYEQVWKKSSSQSSNALSTSTLLSSSPATGQECPPMTVTYRLQGLDGEATEPMIKELEEDREESQDPEVEFSIAGAVQEYGGLEIILKMIERLRDDFKTNQEQLVAVLNLLMYCCKIRENRRALLRLGALGLLLETARRAFSVEAMESAEGILLIVESLTLEANESDDISITGGVLTVNNEAAGTGEQAKKIVLMFLERLCHPLGKKSNKQQRNAEMVARILPYLTYGESAAMEALVQHFNPYLQNWCEYDRLQRLHEENPKDENTAQGASKQRLTVENFVRVSESLRTSSCGERLKDIILEKGITSVAVRYLRESFAVAGQAGFKSSSEWVSALKLPSVPLILSMLRGLSMGHLPTQKCIDEGGILSLLHALEGVPGENEIGARAENLLDTLANKEGNGDGYLEEKVLSLRHATRDEMRRLALRKREQLLQGLGMRQQLGSDGGERIFVACPVLEGLDDVEEEDGLACMVCREGYGLRPNDLLGVYTYSRRVNLGVGTSGSSRGECVYTTVSSFNVIHFQCHLEAKRADAALKNPKKEWEGATLRNNESLCNSLFPLRGPSAPLTQYVRYVDQYWDNLNTLGRADGNRLRLLTYDIVLMLARFATGASFSAESRGGGRESNSKFLPFMVQMARHLLDQGSPSQRRAMAKAVGTYLSSTSETQPGTPTGTQSSGGTEETVQFMMVNSLLSESYESWVEHRCPFLQRGIYHAYMQHTHGRPSRGVGTVTGTPTRNSSAEPEGADELLSIIRPMLVYTGLIEQLQCHLKKSTGAAAAGLKAARMTSASSEAGVEESMEGWETVMKERLFSMKEMMGFSKELLSWLDDMSSITDLQEAFDVIGALADVLSGGFSRCEDFVKAAISAGRS